MGKNNKKTTSPAHANSSPPTTVDPTAVDATTTTTTTDITSSSSSSPPAAVAPAVMEKRDEGEKVVGSVTPPTSDDNNDDDDDEESVEEMEEEEVDKNKFKLDDGSIIDYSQTPDEQAIIDANAAAEKMFYLRRAEELEVIQEEEEKARTEKGIPILDFRAKYEDEKVNGKKYHLITWEQLKRVFCYERVAHGFMIAGDISQKHTQHWDRSKQIKVRDHECKVEGAIFFYDENAPEPHFSWDKVEVGNYVEIKSPRLHKFMDGQDGLRIEDNSQIATIRKRSFTEEKRFEYGKLNKENGNSKYLRAIKMLQDIEEEEEEKKREKLLNGGGKKKKKGDGGEAAPNAAFRSVSAGNRMLDDAIVSYEMAISHLECTFTAFSSEQRLEVRKVLASCFLNVAACQIALKKWDTVEMPCDKALSINASKQLNAKAYYRIAQAMLELGTPRRMAEDKLKRAQTILLPESDPAINALIHKIAVMDYEEKQQEKIMFRNRREARALAAEKKEGGGGSSANSNPSIASPNDDDKRSIDTTSATVTSPFSPNVPSTTSFGLKRSLFGPPPTGLNGVPNFRDLGGLPTNDGKRITKKFVLYRSNTMCLATSSSSLEGALNEFPEASTPNYAITITNPPMSTAPGGTASSRAEAEPVEDTKMRHMKKDLAFIPPQGLIRRHDIEEPKPVDENGNEVVSSDEDENSALKPVKSTWTMEPFNDLKTLVDDFGVKTIIDFRNEHEARAQVKKLKKLRGGKTGKWFQNYQDLFTTIKVICANDDKGAQDAEDSTTQPSTLSESSTADATSGTRSRGPRKVVVGTTINFFKRVFLLLAGGGLQPTPLLDPSATRKRKVWLTIKSRRTHVFQNGILTAAPDTSKRLSLPTPTEGAGGVNGGKPWSKSDIALQDALVNHPVVFRVDLVTRSLISLSSYWLLFTLAICAIFAQIRLASSIMIKYVVNKQTQKDLFVNILTYQGPEIAHVFSILSEPRNYPVVLSCSLGKDRTGLITALVLAACEVKFEAIVKDFSERTNDSLAFSPFLVEEQRLLGLIPAEWDTAKAATLKEVFVFLTMEYGGVLSYLRSIGVTNEQILTMRSLLTRPA